jgi:hypothetical protein
MACMQECTFTNVSAPRPLGSLGRATFYSDANISVGDDKGGAADPPHTLPLSLANGLKPLVVDPWDDFFLNTMKVRACVQGS